MSNYYNEILNYYPDKCPSCPFTGRPQCQSLLCPFRHAPGQEPEVHDGTLPISDVIDEDIPF